MVLNGLLAVCFGTCVGFTVTSLRGLTTAIENAQAHADAASVITLGASLVLNGRYACLFLPQS
jgi:hypothetical protein